ncbi:hypothetical protein BDC45DRAFT_558410 [Circinella umbellata]|nr:hypothetical protein BDC45DRAFT_558410 [Circinella umbellata]
MLSTFPYSHRGKEEKKSYFRGDIRCSSIIREFPDLILTFFLFVYIFGGVDDASHFLNVSIYYHMVNNKNVARSVVFTFSIPVLCPRIIYNSAVRHIMVHQRLLNRVMDIVYAMREKAAGDE